MKYLLFLFAAINSLSLAAQKTTTFYDFYWKPTNVDRARYYSELEKTDSGWLRRDFYINTLKLQMQALYKDSACKIQQGYALYFHPNGTPSSIGRFENNKREGVVVRYHSNGMIFDSATYKEDRPVGNRYYWHRTGFMSDSISHVNDSTDVHIAWFDDGALSFAGYTLWNKKNGKWKYFHRNGNLAGIEVFDKGKVVQKEYFNVDGTAQPDTAKANSDPVFKKGGKEGWIRFLEKNSYWPPGLKLVNTNTVTVGVQFTINEEGKIENIEMYSPFLPAFDKIAMEIVRISPAWIPALANNRKIKFTLRQPITFQQQE